LFYVVEIVVLVYVLVEKLGFDWDLELRSGIWIQAMGFGI